MNMNIKIQARGNIAVDRWSEKVCVDGVPLDDKIAEALAIEGVPEKPFAVVTVNLGIQRPAAMTTYVDGKIWIPEESEKEEQDHE